MPRKWIEPHREEINQEFIDAIGGHRIVAQALYQRGYQDIPKIRGFLDPKEYFPASPSELPDIDQAVNMICKAIRANQRICVWGDFDVDGQTATTLLVTTIKNLGGSVVYHIPVRARESHGISTEILMEQISDGIELLITCDTGISAHQAIQLTNQHQIPVIITDHHDLPPELPEAQAVINPKRIPSNHPLASLPGVGVAYKLAEALYMQHDKPQCSDDLLDLVSLGIVSDLAVLRADTRYLLQTGLPVLRKMPRLGLKYLTEIAELDPKNITEEHISFVLAPRLNAIGRLGDANPIVEFLTTNDPLRARMLAFELEGLNAERRFLSDQVYQAALNQLEKEPDLLQTKAIVLSHESWPAGVIGIAAARLVERYSKPVTLFSTPPGEPARGSARSVEGINICEAIASQAHLIEGYGGHPMAAGLSIKTDKIHEFRIGLDHYMHNKAPASPDAELLIDAYMDLKDITEELVADIERLAPFGMGNPPVFLVCQNLALTGYNAFGKGGEHLVVTLEDQYGYTQRAIWWQGAVKNLPDSNFDLAFTVRSTAYRGQSGLQIEWVDYRLIDNQPITLSPNQSNIVALDFRKVGDPLAILTNLITTPDLQVWCESEDRTRIQAQDRGNLSPCKHLVIWSPPPSKAILHQVIQQTHPQKIYLFGNPTSMDSAEEFIKRLAGLCKFTIRYYSGRGHLSAIAAASNQRVETVKAGLLWLQAYGHIKIISQIDDLVHLVEGMGVVMEESRSAALELRAQLEESSAFRNYYLRVNKDLLINSENNSTD